MVIEYNNYLNYSKEHVFHEGRFWRPLDLNNDSIIDYYCTFMKSGDMVVAIYNDIEWKECGIEVTINDKIVYDSFVQNNNVGD
jgi:hypothetical protein